MLINDILTRLKNVKKAGTGYTALCPAHEDSLNSLGVSEKDGRILFHCFANCSVEKIASSLGLKVSDLFEKTNTPTIVATYDYTDENGNPLYRVVRTEPKGFYQQHYKNGQWVNGLNGIEKVPYNLPNVIAADTVYVVEGEKDANALAHLDIVATTNSGGAGKWTTSHSKWLKGKRVIIIPDNDEPGRLHGKQVAESLKGIASSVTICELTGLGEKEDITDYLKKGNSFESLVKPKIEAERVLIPAVLKDNQQIFDIISELNLEDIQDNDIRTVIATMMDLSNENIDISEITLAERMGKPIAWFSQFTENVPSFTNLKSYFDLIKKKATSQRLSDLANRILEDVQSTNPDELLGFIDSKLDYIRESSVASQGFKSFMDVAATVHTQLEDLKSGKNPAISTGMRLLDMALKGGGHRGELHVWAGMVGGGKSVLMKQIAQNIAKRGEGVGIVTAEMSDYEVFFRMLSPEAEVPAWQVQHGISPEKINQLESKLIEVANFPIFIDDRTTNIFQIRARTKALLKTHNICALFVDYLQLLGLRNEEDFGKFVMTRAYEMSVVSRVLKKLAKELDIWVLAIAQFNREATKKDEMTGKMKPEVWHLAESSALEKDADVVGIIDMDEYVQGQPLRNAVLRIAKNRNSPTLPLDYIFNGDYLIFQEKTEVQPEPKGLQY